MNNEQEIIQKEVLPVIEKANNIIVNSEATKVDAIQHAKNLNDFKKELEEKFHPTSNKKKAYEAYNAALETEKAFYVPCDIAINTIKGKIKDYDRKEALRVQKEQELAEANRREAERKERERLEAQAKKAEEKGRVEKAEALRERAESVTVTPTFTPPPQSVKKLVWKARVVNPLQACQSIGEGLLPTSLVDFKQSILNDIGKTYDGKTKVPGISFYQDVNSRIV